MRNNRFEYSNFNEVFGELQSVHRVKRSGGEVLIILSAVIFLFLFGVVTYVANETILTLPFCVILPFLLVCALSWHYCSTKGDELRIYQNGFTSQSGKKLQTCLWEEIKTYEYRLGRYRLNWEMEQGIYPLDSVEKKSGERIDFTDGLSGTPEIVSRHQEFRKIRRKRKGKSKNKN